jgi:two-component system phosphate regulon response regulator PhoB
MPRVLVIHGDREVVDVLDEQLRRAGHRVECAASADEGLDVARARRPDVVLLDAEPPGTPPARVYRAFEADARTRGLPLIAIAATDQHDPLRRAGMADVLTSPFSVGELLRCIEGALRRARPPVDLTQPIACGALHVDRIKRRVTVGEEAIALTSMEYKLLVALCDARDEALSRETLLRDVWGVSPDLKTRTVSAHVTRLRSKLGEAGTYIVTEPGKGYRFVGPEG